MKVGGTDKRRWVWTRKGFKRKPQHLAPLELVSTATKTEQPHRKKRRRSLPKPADNSPTYAEGRQMAAERRKLDSARVAAKKVETLTTGQNRKAWSGKYDDLTKPHGPGG